MTRVHGTVAVVSTLVLSLLAGCAASAPDTAPFPEGAKVDYQLGGASPVPEGVGIVARDVTDEAPDGVFAICYVNGFQTQPGDARWQARPELLLRDASGGVVTDPNWPDEALLDTSTADARDGIFDVLAHDIRACARGGFDAVELDNLDSFSRAEGLSFEGNSALADRLVDLAHSLGLGAGQKNTGEFSRELRDTVGFDFAVAEECVAYGECDLYTAVYGRAVIDIEYADDSRVDAESICADTSRPETTVYRDRNLVPAGHDGYVFVAC